MNHACSGSHSPAASRPAWCRAGSRPGWPRSARFRARGGDRPGHRLRSGRPRPPARRGRELDPRPRRPLPARPHRDQRLPGAADRGALVRRHRLVGGPRPRAAQDLLLPARPGRERGARRLPRPGPAAVRPLLRPDADPVLLPVRELGRGAPGREGEGAITPSAGDGEDDRLHPGRVAADAGRRDRHRGDRRRRHAELLDAGAGGQPAGRGHAGLDLLLLRRGLPGQDAGLPRPRLDAGCLPGGAAAGARRVLGRPLQGRRLRLPRRGAADLPRRRRSSSRR